MLRASVFVFECFVFDTTRNHTSRAHFNDAKKSKLPNFAAAKRIEIARFLEVPKSKYVQCYLMFMFLSFADQKVALSMLNSAITPFAIMMCSQTLNCKGNMCYF